MSTKSKPVARATPAGESDAMAPAFDPASTTNQATAPDQAPGATAAVPPTPTPEVAAHLTRSVGATAKCLEAINAEMLSFTQQSIAAGVATTRAMMEVRSMQDVLTLQGAYARATVDRLVDHSTKLNEVLLSATKEAFQPFGGRPFPFGGRAS